MRSQSGGLKRFVLFGTAVAGILVMLSGSWSCSAKKGVPVTIGTTTSEVNSLILIALEQGYFTGNGLNVNIRMYPSGKAALDGMLKREVDMATASEYAFAGNVLDSRDVRMVGVINRSSVEYLVGRVDRGIKEISDLEGKTIGVPMKSRPEFALSRFLYLNGIDTSRVRLANVPVERSADALVNGEVDAIATWQPYIDQAKERVGSNVVVWTVQNEQPSYNAVVCPGELTEENPDMIVRFLKSLVQAESYVASKPEAAKATIREKLGYTGAYVESVWPDLRFSVSLDQSVVTAMEDETRWMIASNLTDKRTMPDFVKYIYSDGLKAVKPGAVNIIR